MKYLFFFWILLPGIIPMAQPPAIDTSRSILPALTITGGSGIHTFHILSQLDLNTLPSRSAQDMLRLVPGLFVAQHQGGGKAEQIFLRGFDADHGTDVAISVDGMPVNMVSQAHGQGYADLHFLIPETVERYDFGKGPYYTDHGDFTTAGYVDYHTLVAPQHDLVKLEGGAFHTARIVTLLNLLSPPVRATGKNAYIAAEDLYSDGPFDNPEHFNRANLFGKFTTPLHSSSQLTFIASILRSHWRASGELPNRAVEEGYVRDRFGAIDSSQGGNTTRINGILKLESAPGEHLKLENEMYYSRYFFDLLSNFTFFYFYPDAGDEFRQHEKRNLYGYNGKLTYKSYPGQATLTSAAGWGIRYDDVGPSFLAHTMNGDTILDYIQSGVIHEANLNGSLEETLHMGSWLFDAGVRADYLHFYYGNHAPATDTSAAIYSGVRPETGSTIICPRINIQYTADEHLQFYLRAGKGFHSNDARIVIANQGYRVLPAAFGADIGFNWKPLPRLYLDAALWYLYLQQEFTYGADLGDQAVTPGGRTLRKGIDLSVRYGCNDWLFAKLNVDVARPRGLDGPKAKRDLPLAPTFTSTAALDFRFSNGLNGGISYRYLHDRPANETGTLTAVGYFITDLAINYTRKKKEIGLTIENLLNTNWSESQFEYTSRLKYEIRPVDEVSYTPGTPLFAKLKFSIFF